jgi:uncharacterized phage infection (PIP) family protein YhgE
MTRRLATLAALVVVLTACSEDKGPDGVDPVAWAEQVCKSVEGQAAVLNQTPTTDPGDPAKAKQNLLTYLGNLSAGLDKLSNGVKDAGTPKVNDGTQVVEKVTRTLRDAKQGVDLAKANLDKATVTDAASFQSARDRVGEDLAKLSDLEDPTKDLKANAELNDAFTKAATCKKLDEGVPPSR